MKLAVVALLLILFGAAVIPPIPDETYYWAWSRDLSWSYFDHPPGIAAVLAFFGWILGDGLIGLRAHAVISAAGVLVFAAAGARRLTNDRAASRLVILALLGAPMFLIGYLPGTHDPLLGLAAAFASYAVVRAAEGDRRWSFVAAFVLSASALIKHSAALLAIGALIGLISSGPRGRRLLFAPHPWLGLFFGCAVLSPWIFAELARDGGSIAFQASRVFELGRTRFGVALPLAIGSIALTFGPITAFSWLGSVFSRHKDPARAALAGGAILLFVACVVAVGFGSGEANWPMPALVFSLPLVASFLLERPRLKRVFSAAAIASAALLAVYLIHVFRPFLPIPPGKDPALRAAGFDRVAAFAEQAAIAHDARLIVTRRYQNASLLRYHLRDRWPVLELGSPNGRKSQYDRWARPEIRPGEVVIAVGDEARVEGAVIEAIKIDRWSIRAVRTATSGGRR